MTHYKVSNEIISDPTNRGRNFTLWKPQSSTLEKAVQRLIRETGRSISIQDLVPRQHRVYQGRSLDWEIRSHPDGNYTLRASQLRGNGLSRVISERLIHITGATGVRRAGVASAAVRRAGAAGVRRPVPRASPIARATTVSTGPEITRRPASTSPSGHPERVIARGNGYEVVEETIGYDIDEYVVDSRGRVIRVDSYAVELP